ncbi:HAD hydrolase-like protein [Candidatus Woesearchaeota archaeon]|jgi:putative hydrolase of the HAD superfamily|nr:HAD hydrolase-like protein [Candidatus Woesearchaeota archaeon]
MKEKLLIFDLDDTLIDTNGVLREETVWEDVEKLTLLPGVKDFFINFSGKKVLVTKETDEGLQSKKIEVLKIRDLFVEILICYNNEGKKKCFEKVMNDFPDDELWVIGDRRDSEIRHGNELGLKTMLLKRGKYKNLKAKDGLEVPDYEVEGFEELTEIICKQ